MATGDLIRYNDLSALHSALTKVMRTGQAGTTAGVTTSNEGFFGNDQSAASQVPTMPSTGDLIDDAYYDDIFAKCGMIADYYNITNPFTAVNAGDIVNWTDYADKITAFRNSIIDRFDDPTLSWRGEFDNNLITLGSSTVSDWNGSKYFNFDMNWDFVGSDGTLDQWLNRGGEIRISLSHDNNTTSQSQSWQNLTSDFGTLLMAKTVDDSSNPGVTSGIPNNTTRTKFNPYMVPHTTSGYVDYKVVDATESYYSMNRIKYSMYRSGQRLYCKVGLHDAHVGTHNGLGSDIVTGTTTCTVQALNPSGTGATALLNHDGPEWNVTSNF